MTQSWTQAARLVRCTGFGATGAEVDATTATTSAAFVASLFAAGPADAGAAATPPPSFPAPPRLGKNPSPAAKKQRNREIAEQGRTLLGWWLNRMVATQRPFTERLTLAWHGIFATSADKVRDAGWMLGQNQTQRALATGSFRALAYAMLTHPATMVWLDNQTNTAAAPNENLAREFMELFALGHGNGYTEDDVHQGARALSGWSVTPGSDTATPVPRRHDDGVKTVLGVTGNLDAAGYCDAVLAAPASAPFVLGRVWNQLVSDAPMDSATRTAAVAAYGPGRDIAAGVTAMLTAPGFTAAAGTRVLSPVEWAVGLARAVGAPAGTPTATALGAALTDLGQVPFRPPSVGGWPSAQAWLSASSTGARWTHAHRIAALGHLDPVVGRRPGQPARHRRAPAGRGDVERPQRERPAGVHGPAGRPRRGRRHDTRVPHGLTPGAPRMDTLTRRRFLLASGGVAAAALADSALTLTWDSLHRAAATRPAAAGDRVLVVVTLYGGNDGLNTVVPWADNAYHDARSELAFSDSEVIHLDSRLGLNPSMTGIKSLWDRGQVAIVNGVGYPNPDRSHFRSMDIWQTGSPTSPTSTGWLGRWLDATGDDPLRAVAIGPTLPPLAIGARCTAATLATGPFVPLPAPVGRFVEALATTSTGDSPASHEVATGCSAAHSADAVFATALGTAAPTGATGALGAQLDSVAKAVKAGVPTKVWCVSLGGFDTHSNERTTQENAWKQVDTAVSGFFGALAGDSHRVTMMIHSEFGRRVKANASQGTDHGTAAPVFVIGPEARGGFHGDYPSLTALDSNGDLKAGVDFRAVYGELLGSVLGADPHQVLDEVPAPVGAIRT